MKVQIKQLEPNPYRDMENYPIDETKIQALINSIRETGFWDNLVVRRHDIKYQLAYGHHRLIALRKILKPDELVGVSVKDLDDSAMIRIMANENDSTWGINVKVDDETVKAAKAFLDGHPEVAKKYGQVRSSTPGGLDVESGTFTISRFLGKNWYVNRVARSLERLHLVEDGILSRNAINDLPTEGATRTFVKAVKDIKPDRATQERVAKRISESERKTGEPAPTSASFIRSELLKEKLEKTGIVPKEDKRAKSIEFIDYIRDTNAAMKNLTVRLDHIAQVREDFNSKFYHDAVERLHFSVMAHSLVARLTNLLREDK